MNVKGMDIALEESRKALAEGEVPVGAVIMRGSEILWADHNRREQWKDPTAHAEMLCLRKGAETLKNWRLDECTLYVTMEPCPMCAGAMVMSRLGKCIYGTSDPQRGCCGSVYDLPADPALGGRTKWQAEDREEACRQMIDGFFKEKRREAKD